MDSINQHASVDVRRSSDTPGSPNPYLTYLPSNAPCPTQVSYEAKNLSFFRNEVISMTTIEQIRRTKKYKQVRNSIIDRLERSGNNTEYYLNLVEDYMNMYVTKEMCSADIAERGLNITSIGSTGQLITKKNDSIDCLLRTNQQMIKLLKMLRIEPNSSYEDDEEM